MISKYPYRGAILSAFDLLNSGGSQNVILILWLSAAVRMVGIAQKSSEWN
jgi:hypothetical protein